MYCGFLGFRKGFASVVKVMQKTPQTEQHKAKKKQTKNKDKASKTQINQWKLMECAT